MTNRFVYLFLCKVFTSCPCIATLNQVCKNIKSQSHFHSYLADQSEPCCLLVSIQGKQTCLLDPLPEREVRVGAGGQWLHGWMRIEWEKWLNWFSVVIDQFSLHSTTWLDIWGNKYDLMGILWCPLEVNTFISLWKMQLKCFQLELQKSFLFSPHLHAASRENSFILSA